MRYRVEATERPEGLYAAWGERVFRTQRSTTDGTLLLAALPGDEVPDGFDVEWNGSAAKVVPASEIGRTFSLQTHCRYDDEIYQVAPQTDSAMLTLRWTGQDETRARELGLVDFTVVTTAADLTEVWQTRHDFAETAGAGVEAGTQDQPTLLRLIGLALVRALPPGWQRAGAQFRQVGDYAELEIRTFTDEGNGPVSLSISAPPQLSDLFARLRAVMYKPGRGTWFQGTFTLNSTSRFNFDFDTDAEPSWRLAPNEGGRPSPRAYVAELASFPREPNHVPSWPSAKAGLPLNVNFRLAKPVDVHNEGEPPVRNRPPVPPEESRRVLDYLFRSPVVFSTPASQPDNFAPHGPPDVPTAFHTDGTWIWPAAVPYYLRKYGVPPEAEMVAHIRANGFRPPYVSELLRATAEAEILGKPRPAQTPADSDGESLLAKIERDGEPPADLRAADVLSLLHHRLAEYGVARSAYQIGETEQAREGLWGLRRSELGWEVARPPTDEPVCFTRLEEAARFLLGTLLLYPAKSAGPGDESAAVDWPIMALRGEPPLTLFRTKRIVVLPAGTVVRRFGHEGGNLVHPESTPFVNTSLPYERERERRNYRVQRSLAVLTGITAPWGGLPGGAVAYFLPRPIGQHLEAGSLGRV